jgi:hypothetical protein
MLKWIPLAVDGSPGMIPRGLWPTFRKDFQQAWFFNLVIASLKSEPQGYLDPRLDLWRLAGAHSERFWESGSPRHKAAVLACFSEIAEINGVKYLYFPPLVDVVNQQTKKQLGYRAREDFSSVSKPFPQECGDLSPSQSVFDFEVSARSENDRRVVEGVVIDDRNKRPSPTTGKRAQRVERDRGVLAESVRRVCGDNA